jgi:hypothetical protein
VSIACHGAAKMSSHFEPARRQRGSHSLVHGGRLPRVLQRSNPKPQSRSEREAWRQTGRDKWCFCCPDTRRAPTLVGCGPSRPASGNANSNQCNPMTPRAPTTRLGWYGRRGTSTPKAPSFCLSFPSWIVHAALSFVTPDNVRWGEEDAWMPPQDTGEIAAQALNG